MSNNKLINKKILISTLVILLLIIAFAVIRCCYWATNESINKGIDNTEQNALFWANKVNFTVQPSVQQKLAQDYLQKYFSPWHNQELQETLKKTYALQKAVAQKYRNKPGWGENQHRHSQQWIEKIIDNMNLAKFPNLNMKAIIIADTNVRILPTVDPLFHYWQDAGEGYPFDYLQVTHIFVNTPVAVFNISKDGEWYLIQTPGYVGWVENRNISFVNNKFIQHWQHTTYIVAVKNNQPMFDDQIKLRANTHLGILYPLESLSKNYYKVLIALPTDSQYATSKIINLRKHIATNFPMPLKINNIAKIANDMIAQPYDWGSFYAHNDCSALTMSLFANFGIWLPRNSSDQIAIGQQILLQDLSDAEKEKIIIEKGIPFLTLVHKPGHIMVYVGHIGKKAYILHDTWGLKTKNLFMQEGRAVIGKTVITPLKLGQHYFNVPQSILSGIDKISILLPATSKNGVNTKR